MLSATESSHKKLVTTSISKVKMENIDQGNDYNPIKMLQGRVAGVNISSASGTPGEAPNVTVRGIGSVSGEARRFMWSMVSPAKNIPT